MGYCQQSDLSEKYGDKELQRLTDEVAGTTIAGTEITAAIDAASTLIDSYIGAKYPVPITTPASALALLKEWACKLARLELWGERTPEGSGVRLQAEDVMKILKDIATGKATLPGQEAVAGAVTTSFAVALTERESNFSEAKIGDRFPTP